MTDLVDAVLADHHRLVRLLDDVAASGDARNRRELAEHAIAELVRHLDAEERFLYPAVRRLLPDGDALTERALAGHSAAQQAMKGVQQADAASPEFEPALRAMIEDVRAHLATGERDVLPAVRAAGSADELAELGRGYEQAKRTAPTRPRPEAPANKVVSPGLGLVDKVRDAITGRNS